MSRKKKRTAGSMIRTFIFIIALGVFLFSAAQLARIFMEYKAGTDEYDRIREYVKDTQEEESKTNPGSEVKQEPKEEKPRGPEVDWQSLKSINQEIIGWIQIEGTEISYPVVKGSDNQFYLKHTFEGQSNAAGAIFIDYANSSDFQDCNTIIYGHNMKNGSMFGLLRKYFKDKDSVPGSYIWVCTPDKNYRYEIFSSHVVDAEGEVYTLFEGPGEEFGAYVENMKGQSLVDYGVSVGAEDKVITLSTCTGNAATRFVVQAKMEGAY